MKKPATEAKGGSLQPQSPAPAADITSSLEGEHHAIRTLLDKIGDAEFDVRHLAELWARHRAVEDDVLQQLEGDEPHDETSAAVAVKRDIIGLLFVDLLEDGAEPAGRLAVLTELLRSYMDAEEASESGLFARVRSQAADNSELPKKVEEVRRSAVARLNAGDFRDLSPSVLRIATAVVGPNQTKERETMDRQYERERDSEGRFVSERGRGYSSRSSRYDDEDDDRRSARRRDDDDDRRGRGGWFGDAEGHAEAARRGWDEREGGRSRSSRYDDDRDRGYRSRSSRYEDDDRRYARRDDDDDRRGHGGWFGDSEGHAEAARRGWDEREGYRSRSSRDDDDRRRSYRDDDDRGYRSRSARYDEDTRYSRRRDDDERRGHGGWFGDREGHAEAARRGWDDRRN